MTESSTLTTLFRVGDHVSVARDESRWPSRGTWPQFRGRTGIIVEIRGGEYGIEFGTGPPPRPDGTSSARTEAWFQRHGIRHPNLDRRRPRTLTSAPQTGRASSS
jgi:hypothetical protein